MRVLENCPNLSSHGLACQAGGDTAVCTRNYDLHQTGWSTVLSSGTFTATQDDDVAMVEEQGYLTCTRLDYGAGGGAGGREKSLGAMGAGRLHVRIIVKNSSISNSNTQFGEWYLRKDIGTDEYWDNASRTWTTTPTYNAMPSQNYGGDVIGYSEIVADAITVTADTYFIGVGRFSSQMGPAILHTALVDVQHSDTTAAGARTPQVLLDATILRTADSHKMYHVWGRELWTFDRGVAVAEFRPFWRATDLPENAVKPILHAQHATNTWDAVQFVPITATADLLRFERGISGETTFQLDCPIVDVNGDPVHLTRAHVVRVWARWLGNEGWSDFAPYSVQIGYMITLEENGAFVATGFALGTLSVLTTTTARSYLGIGVDETPRYLDGYMRMWETRRNPIHGLDAMWRI
jgi:hypothetical protein